MTATAVSTAAISRTPAKDGEALAHMTQLDALRAFAVAGVVAYHFLGARVALFRFGERGVDLFFVLSGFLITGILLRCRDLIHGGQSPWLTVRQFYIRRFLRIFPLFYFVLALTWLLGFPDVRAAIGWHVAYLSDVYFFHRAQWQGGTSHLWSLAVEEQFYLVWPWLVLFLNRRALIPVTIGLILAAPITRAWGALHGWNDVSLRTFPLESVDALGLGALLAIGWREFPDRVTRLRMAALIAGILALLAVAVARLLHVPAVHTIAEPLGFALIFCWLVGAAAVGFAGVAGRVLLFRPLLLIGTVSYG
ncbi:MAG TPA: acyltransferase, partial [Tepidisphaeraceae bacterium]|nr:acyltransferase [Tepidisphaeraceae bacterium]